MQVSGEEYAHVIRLVVRRMMPEISVYEFRVLMTIFDRTYNFGKAAEVITFRHFLEGIRAEGGGWISPPVGVSRQMLSNCLTSLKAKKMILTLSDGRKAATYAINSYWPKYKKEG